MSPKIYSTNHAVPKGKPCPCARCIYRERVREARPCNDCSTSYDGFPYFQPDKFEKKAYEEMFEL